MIIYLAVIAAYEIGVGTATFYYSSGVGYNSLPGDTPASRHFEPRLQQPASIKREMFSGGRTAGRNTTSRGDLVLINEDGGLDVLNDHAFDGRVITIYRGDDGAAFSTFDTVLVATMRSVEVGARVVTIKLRDRRAETEVPIQATKYDGDNALPAGLEGVATDLKGKPKPLCYGVVRNISPPLVNTSKLIYQVNDGTVNSIDAVRDKGIPLGRTLGDLTDNANPFKTAGNSVLDLVYSESLDLYVAVGAGSMICTSDDDGATWTERTSHTFTGTIKCVTWSPDDALFVAGGAGGELETSPDGITWTPRTANVSTETINGVDYGDGSYVIVANAGKSAYSTNGTSWTASTPGHSTHYINGVAYCPLEVRGGVPTFVISGGDGRVSFSVNGGVAWRNVTTPGFGTSQVIMVRWLEDHIVASSPGKTRASIDGTVWTEWGTTWDGAEDIRDVAYAEGLYVLVGAGGLFADGTTSRVFTKRTGHPGGALVAVFAVSVRAGVVVMVGGGGYIVTTGPTSSAQVYASEAALLLDSNAPAAGAYGHYLAGGYIRLGSSPAGTVTADVTQGANAAARTAGQIWEEVLLKIGMVSGTDWVVADVTALDSANASVIGLWTGTQEMLASEALNRIARTVGAWWGPDKAGLYRIERLVLPTASADITLVEKDVIGLERVAARDAGSPVFLQKVRYSRNYTPQDADLAGRVSDVRRAELKGEWLETSDTDAAVPTTYLLAREDTVETLFSAAADALTEATRLLTLRKAKRDLYSFQTPLDADTLAIDIGSIVHLTHSRFGLTGGKKFTVVTVEPDADKELLSLHVGLG